MVKHINKHGNPGYTMANAQYNHWKRWESCKNTMQKYCGKLLLGYVYVCSFISFNYIHIDSLCPRKQYALCCENTFLSVILASHKTSKTGIPKANEKSCQSFKPNQEHTCSMCNQLLLVCSICISLSQVFCFMNCLLWRLLIHVWYKRW